jgi:hypothetical protein
VLDGTTPTLARAVGASRTLHDAPEAVIQRAIALFDTRAAVVPAAVAVQRRPGLVQRLAALVFDSTGTSALAFGRRSGGGSMRQLLYSVEGRDVDLRIAADEAGTAYVLSGQVLGPDSAGVVVIEPDQGGDANAVALTELGEFRLPPVQPGRYRLTLELADQAIVFPPLQVPHPGVGA